MQRKMLRQLIYRQWMEQRKAHIIGVISIAAVLITMLMLTWHWRTSFSGGATRGVFLIGLYVGGAVYAGYFFRDLKSKGTAIWYICLPASALEKLCIAVLFSILLFLLVYVSTFYLVEGAFLWIVNDGHTNIQHTDLFYNNFHHFVFTFFSLQSFVLMGSVLFRKFSFAKTILCIVLIFFFLTSGNKYLLQLMSGENTITASIPLSYFQFVYNDENVYVFLQEQVQIISNLYSNLFMPVAFLIITWQLLRETEVK